jgi:hypothetical protein
VALAVIERLMCSARKDSVRFAVAIFIIERAYGKASGTQPKERDALAHESTELLLAVREEMHLRILSKRTSAPLVIEASNSLRLLEG